MESSLVHHADPGTDLQNPADVAVVMPTLLRPSLVDALRSIYAQQFDGRIQILIGIDKPVGDSAIIAAAIAERPSHCVVTILYPGYSTSVRHGGLHPARDGGTLRTLLCYLANARYVSLLDDDNWWHPDHLRLLRTAIQGRDWAFSLRWYVHPATRRPICIDEWESIGPDQGFFRRDSGGWVDPNCLMFDKLACEPVLRCWSAPPKTDIDGLTADRHAFHTLKTYFRGHPSKQATSYYVIGADDIMQKQRLAWMGEEFLRAGRRAGLIRRADNIT